jgi:hypothetical protein
MFRMNAVDEHAKTWAELPYRERGDGVAAYKPPPGTVFSYEMPTRFPAQHGQPPKLAELPPTPEADETTGRSVQTVVQAPEPQRAVKTKTPKRPKVAAPPREPGNLWGAYAASHPAYSGDRPF